MQAMDDSFDRKRLPPAYQRVINLRRDLSRAIGLYGLGDRAEVVLRTLARAKVDYDAIGADVPVPCNVRETEWPAILDELVRFYGFTAYRDGAEAA